uniref:Uncharacterized protein n=1 Tax=Denticeps clupeoides TaxID=299321 RepID=A0AAY4CCY0_9TELE
MSTRSNSAYPCVSDCTLWPFRVDTHTYFSLSGRVLDSGIKIFSPEKILILAPLGWREKFSFKEIYQGSKVNCFKQPFQYSDIMFFHDEQGNVVEVSRLGTVPNAGAGTYISLVKVHLTQGHVCLYVRSFSG